MWLCEPTAAAGLRPRCGVGVESRRFRAGEPTWKSRQASIGGRTDRDRSDASLAGTGNAEIDHSPGESRRRRLHLVVALTPPTASGTSRPLPHTDRRVTLRSTSRSASGQSGRVEDLMSLLAEHGMLLESARGPIPNVAELVAGERIVGSWWSHPKSHAIFAAINILTDSPNVVRLRLLNGKSTLVHRRLWPAMARVSSRIGATRLVSIGEAHTTSSAH